MREIQIAPQSPTHKIPKTRANNGYSILPITAGSTKTPRNRKKSFSTKPRSAFQASNFQLFWFLITLFGQSLQLPEVPHDMLHAKKQGTTESDYTISNEKDKKDFESFGGLRPSTEALNE
jgi:hypothetical protein